MGRFHLWFRDLLSKIDLDTRQVEQIQTHQIGTHRLRQQTKKKCRIGDVTHALGRCNTNTTSSSWSTTTPTTAAECGVTRYNARDCSTSFDCALCTSPHRLSTPLLLDDHRQGCPLCYRTPCIPPFWGHIEVCAYIGIRMVIRLLPPPADDSQPAHWVVTNVLRQHQILYKRPPPPPYRYTHPTTHAPSHPPSPMMME